MHERGIPALGIWAQVPHYIPTGPYPAAALALVEGLTESAGLHSGNEVRVAGVKVGKVTGVSLDRGRVKVSS